MRDVLLGNQRNTQKNKNLTAAGQAQGLRVQSRTLPCPCQPLLTEDKDKDKRQKTKDKRQKTKDKRQKTKDKRQKTKDKDAIPLEAQKSQKENRQFDNGITVRRCVSVFSAEKWT